MPVQSVERRLLRERDEGSLLFILLLSENLPDLLSACCIDLDIRLSSSHTRESVPRSKCIKPEKVQLVKLLDAIIC